MCLSGADVYLSYAQMSRCPSCANIHACLCRTTHEWATKSQNYEHMPVCARTYKMPDMRKHEYVLGNIWKQACVATGSKCTKSEYVPMTEHNKKQKCRCARVAQQEYVHFLFLLFLPFSPNIRFVLGYTNLEYRSCSNVKCVLEFPRVYKYSECAGVVQIISTQSEDATTTKKKQTQFCVFLTGALTIIHAFLEFYRCARVPELSTHTPWCHTCTGINAVVAPHMYNWHRSCQIVACIVFLLLLFTNICLFAGAAKAYTSVDGAKCGYTTEAAET
jgi:hypothetical protein